MHSELFIKFINWGKGHEHDRISRRLVCLLLLADAMFAIPVTLSWAGYALTIIHKKPGLTFAILNECFFL